jgi:hypothetical protein
MCLIILSIIGVVAVLQCLEQLGPFSCGSLIKRILADQISSVRHCSLLTMREKRSP